MRLLASAMLLAAAPLRAADLSPVDMLDISQLARFRPVERVGMFSSYDRTGGNDDGFSGKYSYLRKEGDGLVIAELKGPGVLTRIATPTPPEGPVEIYIDGEKTPRVRIPFIDLFTGKAPPFTGSLVGYGLGGYYSYVPIPFARSVKVVVRAPKVEFYQINYALLPRGAKTRSFQATDSAALRQPEESGQIVRMEGDLPPGGTLPLLDARRGGRIQSLRIGPTEAFAGKTRDIDLRITWDDASTPAIEMPVADFFGYSFGEPAERSLLLGSANGWNYARLPMPFAKAARVELVSHRQAGPPVHVRSEFVVSDRPLQRDEGTLHALWHREAPTREGVPFRLLDVTGRGHVVGFAVQAQGNEPGETPFFEGDDEVTIDGKLVIHGTGTEDMFNGGWYAMPGRWDRRGSLPFSGALDYRRQIARAGGYRLLIADSYPFQRSLSFVLEHGPERNSTVDDYAGTALFYLDRPEGIGSGAPSAAERQVIDGTGFRLGFSPMTGLDALAGASLRPDVVQIGKDWIAFATFARGATGDLSGLEPANATQFSAFDPPMLALNVDAPQAGRYEILVDVLKGPDGAMLQLRRNGLAHSAPVDFYSPARERSGLVSLGQIELEEGRNTLYLGMPGRNAASTGARINLIALEGRLIRKP